MLGVLLSLLFCIAAIGIGYFCVGRWASTLEGYSRIGLFGLIGLGISGTAMYFLGRIPGGLTFTYPALFVIGIIGLIAGSRQLGFKTRAPKGLEWLFVLVPVLMGLIALVGVLTPSNANDWDTIAYHLAVPKIWLERGQVGEISFIHHSNFPFAIDGLYLIGLKNGQEAAKAFNLWIYALGCLSIFGLAKERSNALGGLLAACAFATVPVVVWESGTGYIDVGHGLFCGLGAWLLLSSVAQKDRERILLAGVLLGLGAGSKYTGLVSMGLAGVVALGLSFRIGFQQVKSVLLAGLVAILVCAPWYIKNQITMNNPFYPFYYSVFKGKNWDPHHSEIYTYEQKTFGVKQDGILAPAHAILGLGYQPGRYINRGQELRQEADGSYTGGTGNPLGAVGFLVVAGALIGAIFGKRRPGVGPTLLWLLLHSLVWLFLSQQSRYALSFAPPLAVILGIVFAHLPKEYGAKGKQTSILMLAALAVQGFVTLFLGKVALLDAGQLGVVLGNSKEEYLRYTLPFYEPAKVIDQAVGPNGKVGLYDEVFGYYLNVPYMWASYGHTTEFGYAQMAKADDLLESWKSLGLTHIYINIGPMVADQKFVLDKWMPAIGLAPDQATGEWAPIEPVPLDEKTMDGLMNDLQTRWKAFIPELSNSNAITLVAGGRSWLLFKIN